VAAHVWSATSYKELHRNGLATERWNRLHPEAPPRVPYLSACLEGTAGPIVAVSDYVTALPGMVARWMPRAPTCLGTDGFGRSDTRAALRDFFEVDARNIALAVLTTLAREGRLDPAAVARARDDWGIDPERPDPVEA
jgi:pyruvate dehydrogenase E1 component